MSYKPRTDARMGRMKFRAWHRGTREADYMIGGFFDRFHTEWDEAEMAWFESLLDEDDVDILAWALGTQVAPASFHGPMLERFKRIDYVKI